MSDVNKLLHRMRHNNSRTCEFGRLLSSSITQEVYVFNKAVFPGKYIQGFGAIGELPALIKLLGKQGLILASPSVQDKVLLECAIDLSGQAIHIELFRG